MISSAIALLAMAAGHTSHPTAAGGVPATIWLNASASDPWAAAEEAPFLGDRTLYLWYNYPMDRVTFAFDGTLEVVEVVPEKGWVNLGTTQSPSLFRTVGCDESFTTAAQVRVRDTAGSGGRLCLVESDADSFLCFDFCQGGWFYMDYTGGYVTDGGAPCPSIQSPDCPPAPVAPTTWGKVKASYR